jgi:hypothetical protein
MNRVVVRNRALEDGDVVRVERCHGAYPLPARLAAGTIVTVLRCGFGYADVVDHNGKVWKVAFANLAPPMSIWWNGRWIDRMTDAEGDAAGAAYAAQNPAWQVR